jgi:TatD DNase family protein
VIHCIDTHCHLTNRRFDADRETLIADLPTHGVWRAICIGTGIADGWLALDLIARFPERLSGAIGIDPYSCHERAAEFDADLLVLEQLLAAPGIVALGEIGIEYHHTVQPADRQMEQFGAQLALAQRLDLPVVVHVREGKAQGGRDAHADALATLARFPGSRGVIHSFAGTAAHARSYLDLGWHLSFNGMLGYKGNDALREAARMVPADRLLIETDAPYLPPMPHRGRRCDPAMVCLTAAVVADLRGEREDDVRAWTTRTACQLFKLDLPPEWAAAGRAG